MKKTTTKIAHNRAQFFFSVLSTSPKSAKISYFFSKNGSLSNFYIMTLNAHYKDSRSGCHSNSGSYDYTRESWWEEFTWYLFSPPLFKVITGQCFTKLDEVLYICISCWLLAHESHHLSQTEKKTVVTSWANSFFHSKWWGLKKQITLSCHLVNWFSF